MISLAEDKQLVRYLEQGLSYAQIGQRIRLGPEGVRSRVKRLRRRFGVDNRVALVERARVAGWFRPEEFDLLPSTINTSLVERFRLDPNTEAVQDALTLVAETRRLAARELHVWLRRWQYVAPDRFTAAVLALAALVPLDRPVSELLSWLGTASVPNDGTFRRRSATPPVTRPIDERRLRPVVD